MWGGWGNAPEILTGALPQPPRSLSYAEAVFSARSGTLRKWFKAVDWVEFSARNHGKFAQKSAVQAVDFWRPKRIIIFGLSRVSTPVGSFSRVGFFVLALST
jgi:hypothetical protein